MTIARARSLPPASERRWVLGFALLVMLVTTLPYLLGFAVQGLDWRFTGFVFGVEDGNSYIAKMLSGAASSWLFRTPYTTALQRGVVAFLPYILLGKLAAPPGEHVQLVVLYHLFRIGAGVLAILATYDFLALFLREVRLRRFGLILAVLGGGLGWVLVLSGQNNWLGSLPLEFYSPETFGFLGLFGIPHLSLARAALLWGLLFYLISAAPESQPELRNILKIGGFWLLAAVSQPLTALIMGGVIALHLIALGLWQFWRWRRSQTVEWAAWWRAVRLAIFSGLIPGPFLIYTALAFRIDPFLKAWTGQNLILSPNPLHYLVAYGLLIPFAGIGAWNLLRRDPWQGWLPIAWLLALPFLAYAPFNLQRRLPEGIWVALVVLALLGFEHLKSGKTSRVVQWSFPLAAVLIFPSTLLLFAGGVLSASHPGSPAFRPTSEVAAFQFIEEQSKSDKVVLASYNTGNALPAWAPVRVVVGHGPESVNLAQLLPQVKAFYQVETLDSQRKTFLDAYDITTLFWGPAERALGDWDPHLANFLRPVYQGGDYAVFQVIP